MLLTKRQREILTIMQDHAESDDGELVYERGTAYLGYTRVAARTVFALLRLCAIRSMSQSDGCERYTINDTGRHILETGALPGELGAKLVAGS